MDKKDDLRVIKTKKILYETLIELMKTKTFEEIKTLTLTVKKPDAPVSGVDFEYVAAEISRERSDYIA